VNEILTGLRAPTTNAKTRSALNHWITYCVKKGTSPIRLPSEVAYWRNALNNAVLIMRFGAYLVKEIGLTHGVAADYLTRLLDWHVTHVGVPMVYGIEPTQIKNFVKALRNKLPGEKRERRALRVRHLRSIADLIDFSNILSANIFSAFVTAFGALMRVGEYTVPKASSAFDKKLCLTRKDIQFKHRKRKDKKTRVNAMIRPEKSGKESKRKATKQLLAYECGDILSAGFCLEKLLFDWDPVESEKAGDTPLFRDPSRNGAAITAPQIRHALKQCVELIGLNPKFYSTHSLRSGGATALFHAGASPLVIQLMGRWSSEIYQIYIRCKEGDAIHFAELMTQGDAPGED